ncbi:MAG: T9SS type A sorting domain-containing protein [Bacteroidetes bacterium]|nr:T9SS type A sorting domain-containing protein [Bacteroidota bacterium]
MKFKFLLNLVLLISVTCIFNTTFAGDRTVLVERFTSSTCGPCASNNPTVDAFMNSLTSSQIMGLSFHMNWPSPGNDPMYMYNIPDNTTRRTYYNVNAIPQLQMDGILTLEPNYSNAQLTNAFNTRTALLSPVTIIVRQTDIGTDSMQVLVTVYCETAIATPSVTMQVAIMEKLIQYPSPPGTNGETSFHTVMRRMLPNASGITFDLTPGTRKDYEFRIKKDALWNPAQIQAVAYVQTSNKEVLNSAWKLSDFCLLPNTAFKVVNSGTSQNANYKIAVPYIADGYNSPVTFSASVVGNPAGVSVTFPSGNTLSNFPDSVSVNVASTGSVPAGIYQVVITGTNGLGKSHKVSVNYNIGRSFVNVGANKPSLLFNVDGNAYGASQLFTWDLNSNHNLSVTTPQVFATTRYVFQNWSNGSTDTAQTVNINTNISSYVANFKTQYKLTANTNPAGMGVTIPSAGQFWDENSSVSLSVSATQVSYNGKTYYFQRWLGGGNNSYTGTNPSVSLNMTNPINQIAIYDTIDVGISNLGTGIPDKYNLYQNYPNPFNPTTNIKFDIPNSSFTSLKVYDINGREVAELLSQNLQAGRYEYSFNASALSSGVYYFKLDAGEFNQIRKMILVK